MAKILSSIACNLDSDLLKAVMPLFEREEVEGIEWSFDTLYKFQNVPDWFPTLLQTFGSAGRLIGHGIYFSLFSGKWLEEQQNWLDHLGKMASEFQFDHVTEHFGFMTGKDFHQGAPLSVPYSKTTLAIGQDRLKRMAERCRCPVGLENLAFAYSLEEVKIHGAFLTELIEPVNGFIILDLHNLFCQSHNFEVDFKDLVELYPLEKVREIHISGGSWQDSSISSGEKVRRDTHDEGVPNQVFQFLQTIIPFCPNLKFVVLEQLGRGLKTSEKREQFRRDFRIMKEIVSETTNEHHFPSINGFAPPFDWKMGLPLENEELHAQQNSLSAILETANGFADAKHLLSKSSLAQTDWKVESWSDKMLETAVLIAQKWKGGFSK